MTRLHLRWILPSLQSPVLADIKGGTAIKLAENVTAKFKVKDGTVIVTRSEKHEHQHSF